MRRLELGEVADQRWCPAPIRDGVRNYLQLLGSVTRLYQPALPLLVQALVRTSSRAVVDLGAGTGGPWRWLQPELERALGEPVRVVLTDRQPSTTSLPATAGDRIRLAPEPVDARAVGPDPAGTRTMFASFHHFSPDDARAVLADAVAHADGIVIIEPTKRALWPVLMMLTTPAPAWLLTPLLRPVDGARLALTYLLPAIPLAITYDGVASCLRSYTPPELLALAHSVDTTRFTWEAGEIATGRPPFVPLTYLVGLP